MCPLSCFTCSLLCVRVILPLPLSFVAIFVVVVTSGTAGRVRSSRGRLRRRAGVLLISLFARQADGKGHVGVGVGLGGSFGWGVLDGWFGRLRLLLIDDHFELELGGGRPTSIAFVLGAAGLAVGVAGGQGVGQGLGLALAVGGVGAGPAGPGAPASTSGRPAVQTEDLTFSHQ